ncbi:Hypothetical predicted protein, partial [Pelobates cultripes]
SVWMFGRSCENIRSSCNISGSLLQGSVQLATSCCDSDNCDPIPLNWPPIITKKNGVACPSCASALDTQCTQLQNTECTGNENRCATVEMSVADSRKDISGSFW